MKHIARWYVYKITRPSGEIVYIGKGSGKRMNHSLRHKLRLEFGLVAEVVANFWDERFAYDTERGLIAQEQPAYNRSKGGDGGMTGKNKNHRKLSDRAAMLRIARDDKRFYANCDKYGTRAMAADLVVRFGHHFLPKESIQSAALYLKSAGAYQGIST